MKSFLKSILLVLALMLFVSNVRAGDFIPKSFSADIVKKTESAVTGKTLKSKGKVFYKAPKSWRFEITGPNKSVFVTNGKKTWYYVASAIEGEPGELKVGKAGKNGMSQFFSTLKSGLESNDDYDVEKKERVAVINFKEKLRETTNLKKAVLEFSSDSLDFKNVKNLSLTYTDGKNLAFVFDSFDLDPKLTKKTFIFEKPENTRTQSF